MSIGILWFLLIVLHLLLCIFLDLLLQKKFLCNDRMTLVFVLFLPIYGLPLLLLSARSNRKNTTGRKNQELEVMLRAENEEEEGSPIQNPEVIPLQDALLLNDAKTRRSSIMEVLLDQPSRFVRGLHEASKSEDTEVIHYATTALSELNRDYELRLQALSQNHEENPDNLPILDRYISVLSEYLEQGMVEGRLQKIQRQRLIQLLFRRLQLNRWDMNSQLLLGEALFLDGQLEETEDLLEITEKLFGRSDRWAILKLRLLYRQRDREGLSRLIRELSESTQFHGRELRERIDFWKKWLGE